MVTPMNVTIYPQKKWDDMIDNDKKATKQVKRKAKLNFLILTWLVNECHINAVRSFSKDLGLDFEKYIDNTTSETNDDANGDLDDIDLVSEFDNIDDNDDEFFKGDETVRRDLLVNNLKTIKVRHAIKISILKGETLQTFELINLHFPNLFDKNHLIYFKLLHLHLIEMIRHHVIAKAQREVTEAEKKHFLNEVLTFVKENLSSLKILSNKIFIKELELTMVLLCYTDEMTKLYQKDSPRQKIQIPVKLRKFFDKSQRMKIAKLINKSILLDINNDDDINLIRYDDDEQQQNQQQDADEDLILKFNQLDNVKLISLIKLWIWSENRLSASDVIFPGINLDL